MARYLSSGTLDTSFNATGKLTFSTLDKISEYGSGLMQNTFDDKNYLYITGFAEDSTVVPNPSRFTIIQIDLSAKLVNW